MEITNFIGGGYKEMLGRQDTPEQPDYEQGSVMSVDEAEDLYYQSHTCISDDADAERGRIERWCEDMNITVTD